MPKPTSVHVCSACGHETARWAGRCPGCGEWNTLVEQVRSAGPKGGGGAGRSRARSRATPVKPVALRDVEAVEHERLSTGIGELDNVLGGGIVPGSLVLIGGAPGIGKSTLTTMALANLCGAGGGRCTCRPRSRRRRSGCGRSGWAAVRRWRCR